MKKTILILATAGVGLLYSCGPTAEQRALAEQAREDSIAVIMEQFRQDSITRVEKARQDSMAAVEKARQDSIAQAKHKKHSKKGEKK